MDINFNPATPEGQQQLQTQGVLLISNPHSAPSTVTQTALAGGSQ
jgi:hypothetical protein